MPFAEYDAHDALGLAALVKKGEVSPAELCEEAIARIESVNSTLNAVVIPMYDEARRVARGPLPDGPFRGVPFLLKNLRAAYAGAPLNASCRFLRDNVPAEDSELVRRYKAAGLVILGRTNTPELGIMPVTEPDLYGPTKNPWDPTHTSGGSSGGSAAAVASGMVPAAHGSDGGGSIRIPASCCGVFGLKPSRGHLPNGPDESEMFYGFASEHVLSRTVRDSAAMLDAATGPEPSSLYHAPHHDRPFLEEVGRDPGKLRVAFTTEPLLPAKIHPDCVRAAEDAARLCASLGHEVTEARPDIDARLFARSFFRMFCATTATELAAYHRVFGREVTARDLEPATYGCALIGRGMSAIDFGLAFRALRQAQRNLGAFLARYDVLLTPTLAMPPLKVGEMRPRLQELALELVGKPTPLRWLLRVPALVDFGVDRAYAFTPFTPPMNVAGVPSMSVPLSWNASGLPIGVMFTSALGGEPTLFRLAGQLEAVRPWAQNKPRVHASHHR